MILYQIPSPTEKTLVLYQHIDPGMITQKYNPPFKTIFFNQTSINNISLLCNLLGYKKGEEVDETLLSFLAQLNHVSKEYPKWDICGFLSQEISYLLTEFPSLEVFRYPSILFFMFLFHNLKHFEALGLNMTDEHGRDLPFYECNTLFFRCENNSNYIDFAR